MDLERKTVALTGAKAADDGHGSFTGYASLWDRLDLQGDIVVRGAFTATLPQFLERGFVAWAHDWANPVATIRDAVEDETGLLVTADFHSDPTAQTARTRTAERLSRGKFVGLSIGFRVAPGGADYAEGVRLVRAVELYETSLVTVPALPDAGVTAAKADTKPYAGEHACRLHPPGRYDRFRRQNAARTHDGKAYDVIFGHLKDRDAWEEQAYRYPVARWTEAAARAHCRSHDGQLFEPATSERSLATALVDVAVAHDTTLAAVQAELHAALAPDPPRLPVAVRAELEAIRARRLGVAL